MRSPGASRVASRPRWRDGSTLDGLRRLYAKCPGHPISRLSGRLGRALLRKPPLFAVDHSHLPACPFSKRGRSARVWPFRFAPCRRAHNRTAIQIPLSRLPHPPPPSLQARIDAFLRRLYDHSDKYMRALNQVRSTCALSRTESIPEEA